MLCWIGVLIDLICVCVYLFGVMMVVIVVLFLNVFVMVFDDGSFDVFGVGKILFGYIVIECGVFVCLGFGGIMGVYIVEVEVIEYGDEVFMMVEELSVSVSCVFGVDLLLGEFLWMMCFGYLVR